MGDSYSFFDDFDDEGVFANKADPFGSYGDKDAIEDLNADRMVAPIQMAPGLDGIPSPCPSFDGMKILSAPSRVTMEEMVCLAGPCKYYVEHLVRIGTKADGTPLVTFKKYCTRLRTWAEVMSLEDVDVLACSGHILRDSTVQQGREESERIARNFRDIDAINAKALATEGHDLGICHTGGCRHYIVLAIRTLDVEGNFCIEKRRFCAALAGAARPRLLLSYQPVIGCSSLDCRFLDDQSRSKALNKNQGIINEYRERDASRAGTDRVDLAGCCESPRVGVVEEPRPAPSGGDVPAPGPAGDVHQGNP